MRARFYRQPCPQNLPHPCHHPVDRRIHPFHINPPPPPQLCLKTCQPIRMSYFWSKIHLRKILLKILIPTKDKNRSCHHPFLLMSRPSIQAPFLINCSLTVPHPKRAPLVPSSLRLLVVDCPIGEVSNH